MYTVGKLSELTGIDVRTLQYWSDADTNGKTTNGAGILTFEKDKNGKNRLYGEQALMEILFVLIGEASGYRTSKIKSMLQDPDTDLFEDIDGQIEALLEQRRELDRKIQLARVIKLLREAAEKGFEESLGDAILQTEISSRIVERLSQSIEAHLTPEAAKTAMPPDDGETKRLFKLLDEYHTMVDEDRPLEDINKKAAELDDFTRHAYEQQLPSFGKAGADLLALWEKGIAADSDEAQGPLAEFAQPFVPFTSFFSTSAVKDAVDDFLWSGYTAAIAEFAFGEGFSDYLKHAIAVYFDNREKQKA